MICIKIGKLELYTHLSLKFTTIIKPFSYLYFYELQLLIPIIVFARCYIGFRYCRLCYYNTSIKHLIEECVSLPSNVSLVSSTYVLHHDNLVYYDIQGSTNGNIKNLYSILPRLLCQTKNRFVKIMCSSVRTYLKMYTKIGCFKTLRVVCNLAIMLQYLICTTCGLSVITQDSYKHYSFISMLILTSKYLNAFH